MATTELSISETTSWPQESAQTRSRVATISIALLLSCILLAPIWMVKYPPLIDYPDHLARTFIIAHLHDPQLQYTRFYAVSWNLYPYLAMDLLLLLLQQVMNVTIAGKVLLSIAALAVPVSAWMFLRRANPGYEALAIFALLIPYNSLFLEGLTNTYLSLSLCFFCLALWLKYVAQPRWSYWLPLLGLTTTLYFTHLLGFAMAGLIMTGFAALRWLPLRRWLWSWALFVPGAACYGWLRLTSTANWSHEMNFAGFGHKVIGLIDPIRGYSNWLDILTAAIIIAAFGLAWLSTRKLGWSLPWTVLVGVLLLLYFVSPVMYGDGWDADKRILPFVLVTALAVPRVGKQRRWLVLVGFVLFCLRVTNVTANFVNEQPRLQAIERSFTFIPPRVRMLPVVEVNKDRDIQKTYLHFWSYAVIERGWFCPYIFTAKNVHALRRTYYPYVPDVWGSSRWGSKHPDFEQVRSDYDYVWAYRVPQFAAGFSSIGSLVYQDGDIAVYKTVR